MWMRNLTVGLALLASPAVASGIEITVANDAGVKGVIAIDLLEDIAPKHVEQITKLAAEGAYDGVVFHRVIDGFMAQTGDVKFGDKTSDAFSMRYAGMGGSELADLPAEFSEVPFDKGVVGMARSQNPNSANSQFFIMFEPGHFLNNQYTVVGRVSAGQDVVDGIKRGKGQNGSVTGSPDFMKQVVVTE